MPSKEKGFEATLFEAAAWLIEEVKTRRKTPEMARCEVIGARRELLRLLESLNIIAVLQEGGAPCSSKG